MTALQEVELGKELTFDYNAVTESLNKYTKQQYVYVDTDGALDLFCILPPLPWIWNCSVWSRECQPQSRERLLPKPNSTQWRMY
jgi:hypothetical protein